MGVFIFRSMCITIPSSANVGRSRAFPAWVWLTSSPFKLLTFGGVFGLSLWLLQMALGRTSDWEWMILNLLFGVAPMFLFGVLLSYLPDWLKVTPLRYVHYGALFFLMSIAQLVFHASLLFAGGPGLVFLGLLLFSWGLVLKYVRQFLSASYQKGLLPEWGLFIILSWGAVTGAGLSAWHLIWGDASPWLCWLGGLSYLPPLILLTLFRFTRAPGRIH